MKSNKWNYLFITIASIGMLIFVYMTNDINQLYQIFKTARLRWIFLAIICMVIYWLLESGVLYCTANSIKHKLSFTKAIQTTMVGQLFNNITPFASGGQPVQLYYLTKEAFHLGEASSILLMKFIVYQGALVVYSTLLLLGKFNFFIGHLSNKLGYLVFIGFTVNFVVIIGLFAIGYFPVLTTKLTIGVIRVLAKLHIIKHKDKTIENVRHQIEGFHQGFRILMNNKKVLLNTIGITMLQLTAFFCIPFCICMALKIENASIISIIAASAFVLMISSFVPLPGASGGAEGSFYLFFGIFIMQSSIIAVAVIVWRLITFYLPIFIGIFFCRIGNVKKKMSTVS